jgi:predicted dehydrogenase
MKVAICGVWHVHAPDYTKKALENGQVVGVYDDNPKWKADFAAQFGIPAFDTLEDLLQSDAEGVIVCTATDAHADVMVKIAQSGKHIFTEKVLALTEADCCRVEEAVKAAGVRFVISLVQKYTAVHRTVKDLIDRGELGQLNYVRFRNCHSGSTDHWLPAHFYNRKECGGGAMIDLGAHGMYLIDWLLGEPQTYASAFTHSCRDEKDAELNPDGIEDNAVTVMTYADGTIAVNETGFVTKGFPMTLEVGGSKGYAVAAAGKVTLNGAEVELLPAADAPILAFLRGEEPAEAGMACAKALTRMMVGAYGK